jgi:hypothetical protein
MDRDAALEEESQAFGVRLERCDRMAQAREAGRGDEADVARADDDDP